MEIDIQFLMEIDFRFQERYPFNIESFPFIFMLAYNVVQPFAG